MGQSELFEVEGAALSTGGPREPGTGAPRLVRANRQQLLLQPMDLDALLPSEHPARAIWRMVEGLDLSRFYAPIRARENESGRPTTDPKVLLALWLFATTEGIGAARELERRCERDAAYRWLRGGVPVNYHTLSDFRSEYGEQLDELLTQVLAAMAASGAVELDRIAQDGTRVRASAGKGSFRREETLRTHLTNARECVEAAKRTARDTNLGARKAAAQQRAALEREARIHKALEALGELKEMRDQQTGGKRSRGEPRASTTDPDARIMRMPDKGFRPAFNVQLATADKGNVIVGVEVAQSTDSGQVEPMLEQIKRRTGEHPEEYVVDGGYTSAKTLEHAAEHHVTLYTPVPARKGVENPHEPQKGDSPPVREWRQRMATAEAQVIYRQRSTAERPNADLKTWRTLGKINVRGTRKVLSVVLLNALAYNILHWISVIA